MFHQILMRSNQTDVNHLRLESNIMDTTFVGFLNILQNIDIQRYGDTPYVI